MEVRPSRRDRPIVLVAAIRLMQLLLVGVAYYVSARLSLRLALIARNVTPLWPPTGIALVAFLVFERRVWPAVLAAAFAVNLPISATPLAAAATAIGNTIAPIVAATLLLRVGFHRAIDRSRDALAIVFLAALLSMVISATIGAVTLEASGVIQARDLPGAWAVWWTGDAMGVLVVAPFLLSLLSPRVRGAGSWARRAEALVLFALLVAISLAVSRVDVGVKFLVLPLLVWIAWRFQLRGAAPAALVVTGIATWAVGHDWGSFVADSLLRKTLILQAFNATVALTASFFAALVTERMRAQRELEISAAELEERVRGRTLELSVANDHLRREIIDRSDAENRLRQRERQLADAQQLAHLGGWDWSIPENRVTWTDEMYRIHGYQPQEFPLTFERASELIVPEDLARIKRNVSAALKRGVDLDMPGAEYRIVRPDGVERVLFGRSKLRVDPEGRPVRMVGTVQDITEEKRAERERRIAETLQRSMLPERLPEIPGMRLAATYVPASSDMEVGGDWYDVIQLSSGRVGVAIGDVAGHGLRAATSMGQLRMALRAYALEEDEPSVVVERVHRLVHHMLVAEMATLVYVVYDADADEVRFANAGHPPPLLIDSEGEVSFLEGGLAPPLGVVPHPSFAAQATVPFPAGSTLVLFTDGLVERRGDSLQAGLARLKEAAAAAGPDVDALPSRLVGALLSEDEISDDVALLAVSAVPLAGRRLQLTIPAEPNELSPLRHTLRRWLRANGASEDDVFDILVACTEACANAIQHPYGARDGALEIELGVLDRHASVTVRDSGQWRAASPSGGGRGLRLMRELMDEVEVEPGGDGTVVRMRRRLGAGGRGAQEASATARAIAPRRE